MAGKFDPDAYLKTNAQEKNKKGSAAFDPDAYLAKAAEPQKSSSGGIGQSVLDTVVKVGETIDSYTGAPTRAAIGAIQNQESPLSAFVKQFGKDPKLAPTGKDITSRAGFSTEDIRVPGFIAPLLPGYTSKVLDKKDPRQLSFSPAGVTGLAVDILADPTNVVPVGALAKGAGKLGIQGAGQAAKLGIQGSAKGIDVLTGTKVAGKTVDLAAEGANKVRNVFNSFFKPSVADDFDEFVEIAQKHNIPKDLLPEAVEFGHDSAITRAARVRAEGPLGEKYLKKFSDGLDSVDKAVDNVVASIGGGKLPSKLEAGEAIQDGFLQAENAVFQAADTTYNSLAKKYYAVPIQGSARNKLFDRLEDLSREAEMSIKKALPGDNQVIAAKSVLKAAENIVQSSDTLDDYADTMRRIGEIAFPKNKNVFDTVKADRKRLAELYFDMREAFVDTIQAIDPADAAKLKQSNEILSGFFKKTDKLRGIIGDTSKSPERIFESLVANGDLKTLNDLKSVLPAESIQTIKAGYLNSIVPRTAEDGIAYRTLANSLNKRQEKLAHLLSPDEAKDITDLAKMGTRFGTRIMSTSGTGASNAIRNMVGNIQSALIDDATIESLKKQARGQLMDIPVDSVKGTVQKYVPIADPTARSYMFRKGAQTYSTQQNKPKEGK